MNKKITLLFTLLAFAASSFAQISFDVKEGSKWIKSSDFEYNLTSYLTNNTTNDADTTFEWYLSSSDMPEGWDVTVCSGLLCIPNPVGKYEVFIRKGEKMDFKLGFAPFGTVGDGSAWVVVESKMNPMLMDSFFLEVRAGTASVSRPGSKESFTAYPNPMKDKVTVNFTNSSTSTVMIYDILGSLKKSVTVSSGASISVADLPKGIYVMKIDGDNTYSKVIQKL